MRPITITTGPALHAPTRARRAMIGAALAIGLAAHAAAQTFPTPDGAVNDFAGVLNADSRAALTALIEDVEKDTTAEIAVATVASLEGISVEEYANTLFNRWGVGQKATDNGVLVLVAPAEREIRIEVGYGLEGVLPDGLAGAVIREQFVPRFRPRATGRHRRSVVDHPPRS